MLDSSPVALPPLPRPLKRTASTASLPTPPRTRHKRTHRHSRSQRGSSDTETDSGSGSASEGEDQEVGNNKRRRMGEIKEDDEEAFWMGGVSNSTTKNKASTAVDKRPKSRSASPVPLVLRRLQGSTSILPVSPPPSHRKTTTITTVASSSSTVVVTPGPSFVSPPSTPKAKFPLRDSPNNPFLVSGDAADDDEDATTSDAPRTPTPAQEKPTVTYVFRGVRGVFPNPLFNHAKNRALSPDPASLLPPEHPDYSPPVTLAPKLLFPSKQRPRRKVSAGSPTPTLRKRASTRSVARTKGKSGGSKSGFGSSVGLSDEDSDHDSFETGKMKPIRLDFGAVDQSKTRSQSKSSAASSKSRTPDAKVASSSRITRSATAARKGGEADPGSLLSLK